MTFSWTERYCLKIDKKIRHAYCRGVFWRHYLEIGYKKCRRFPVPRVESQFMVLEFVWKTERLPEQTFDRQPAHGTQYSKMELRS